MLSAASGQSAILTVTSSDSRHAPSPGGSPNGVDCLVCPHRQVNNVSNDLCHRIAGEVGNSGDGYHYDIPARKTQRGGQREDGNDKDDDMSTFAVFSSNTPCSILPTAIANVSSLVRFASK